MALPRKAEIRRIVFESDTPAGRRFDEVVIGLILLSVAVAIADSSLGPGPHQRLFDALEWGFTLVFTAEYLLRLWCSPFPLRYARSFFGIVDLLATVPSYLAVAYSGANMLLVMRLVRVLRLFRLFRLLAYVREANVLLASLYASRRKILVFLCAVFVAATVFGALLYAVEGPENGFTSIPKGIYWAVITITTVGYGDMVPHTPLGQMIATVVMLVGYSVLAVPTGIVTSELVVQLQRQQTERRCPACERRGHEQDAKYCRHCGARLQDGETG